jgi:hypothetical protein
MKRLQAVFIILTLLMLACALPTNTPQAPTSTPTNANGLTATHTVAITPSLTNTAAPAVTPSPQANVTCNNLSFYLDPALASGFHCETIPESSNPDDPAFALNPQTTRVTLDGYSIGPRFHTPHIEIFSVQRFQQILPDQANARIADLQALLAGAPPSKKALPLLPVFNAAEMFKTKYAILDFQNGKGIRYLTQYAQAFYLVNNHDMFLSFQGMTADGAYWISIILPITHPSLPENGDNPPGNNWVDFQNNADAYFSQKASDLNAQPAGSFAPSIELIDSLIHSITIQP